MRPVSIAMPVSSSHSNLETRPTAAKAWAGRRTQSTKAQIFTTPKTIHRTVMTRFWVRSNIPPTYAPRLHSAGGARVDLCDASPGRGADAIGRLDADGLADEDDRALRTVGDAGRGRLGLGRNRGGGRLRLAGQARSALAGIDG